MHTLNVNGKKITDIKEIINHEVKFYKDLYSSDNITDTSIHSYLNDTFDEAGNGFGKTYDFKFFPVRIDFIFADDSFEVTSF